MGWSRRPTGLHCFNTVGLVIWPVKIVSEMTFNVLSGTLSLCTTTTILWCHSRYICCCSGNDVWFFWARISKTFCMSSMQTEFPVFETSSVSDVVLKTQVLVSRLSFNVLISVLVLGHKVLVWSWDTRSWSWSHLGPFKPWLCSRLGSLELYSWWSYWHECLTDQ